MSFGSIHPNSRVSGLWLRKFPVTAQMACSLTDRWHLRQMAVDFVIILFPSLLVNQVYHDDTALSTIFTYRKCDETSQMPPVRYVGATHRGRVVVLCARRNLAAKRPAQATTREGTEVTEKQITEAAR